MSRPLSPSAQAVLDAGAFLSPGTAIQIRTEILDIAAELRGTTTP